MRHAFVGFWGLDDDAYAGFEGVLAMGCHVGGDVGLFFVMFSRYGKEYIICSLHCSNYYLIT